MNEIIASGFKSDVPKVGMGVTELCYSDRHAWTIVEILSPRRIIVQRDRAERIDSNGMSEMQEYRFIQDKEMHAIVLSLRKDGHWREVGRSETVFMLGRREEYYDYSF